MCLSYLSYDVTLDFGGFALLIHIAPPNSKTSQVAQYGWSLQISNRDNGYRLKCRMHNIGTCNPGLGWFCRVHLIWQTSLRLGSMSRYSARLWNCTVKINFVSVVACKNSRRIWRHINSTYTAFAWRHMWTRVNGFGCSWYQMTCKKLNNMWVTMKTIFVSIEAIQEWFSRVTKSRVKIIAESPHEWKHRYSR